MYVIITHEGVKVLVAVVTGASRGFGRQTAITLLRAGYHVALNYNESEPDAGGTAGRAVENIMAVKADVGVSSQVEAMAESIYKRWGRVDALINNAGITRDKLLLRCTEDDWEDVLKVNLKGCFNTVRTFAPLLQKSGGGHIVNIASYSGARGRAGQAAYSASKAAVLGFTYSMAKELAEYDIRVNSILPGYMPTDMGRNAGAAMKAALEESLLKRLSDPAEAAGFIAYLLTTKNITGQVFNLDSRI